MRAANSHVTGVLMVGVGGQGIILAGDVLSLVAMAEGFDVKKSEVHGMSQRGGTVTSHVRFGPKVWSPMIPEGEADVLLGFEAAETLRALHLVAPAGSIISSTQRIIPPIAAGKKFSYPENPFGSIRASFPDALAIDAQAECRALGNERMLSVLMLGALSAKLTLGQERWRDVIFQRVPKGTQEANWRAFLRGRELAGA